MSPPTMTSPAGSAWQESTVTPAEQELASEPVSATSVSERFLKHVTRDFARQHLVLSQGADLVDGVDTERLAVADTTAAAAIHNLGVHLGCHIESFVADAELIARAIDEAYGQQKHADSSQESPIESNLGAGIESLLADADRDLLSTQGKAPIIKFIDAMLFEALGQSASDIHIQPTASGTLVRYRLDGVLHTVRELPSSSEVTAAITSRIKVMGRMDIAERRVPQDGRASVTIGDRSIDLRISTLPTSHGERVVIRLLDNARQLGTCDLVAGLGMPREVAEPYLDRASRANGMILLTGPTGSGKTTTLYATLRAVGSDALNIMTIEDPIEYELSVSGGGAVSQSQVNLKKGVTFATGLRHILRQDPDVVMVGEIRDSETARIAIQASLTGHLVFSTLHTNDAASATTRLIDLDVEAYLVSASLSAVLAQRLVRVFHRQCAGQGCAECLNTGFRGRRGLYELLVVTERIAELISARAPLADIRGLARAEGMRTLKEDGERLVSDGLTSLVEVHRVVQGAA